MLRRLKRIVVVMVCLISFVGLSYAEVSITDTGYKKKKLGEGYTYKGFTQTGRKITIHRGNLPSYSFTYRYTGEENEKEDLLKKYPKFTKYTFPYVFTDGDSSGLSLARPWYRNGSIDIKLNGKSLVNTLAKINAGENGIETIWDSTQGLIKANFAANPDEDNLYLEITIDPKEEVKSLMVDFRCFLRYSGVGDPWISTATRNIQHHNEADTLDKDKEPWIFCFDTTSNRAGTAALFYLPEEVKEVTVFQRKDGMTWISFHYPITLRKLHFIIYSLPDSYKTQEEAFKYLKENGNGLLEKLRKFKSGNLEQLVER